MDGQGVRAAGHRGAHHFCDAGGAQPERFPLDLDLDKGDEKEEDKKQLIGCMELRQGWQELGRIAAIWKGGCIIRITAAYAKDAALASLLMDENFTRAERRRGALSASLAFFDAYRRARLPANLTQSQRDYFGAHAYQRKDGLPDKDAQGHAKFVIGSMYLFF